MLIYSNVLLTPWIVDTLQYTQKNKNKKQKKKNKKQNKKQKTKQNIPDSRDDFSIRHQTENNQDQLHEILSYLILILYNRRKKRREKEEEWWNEMPFLTLKHCKFTHAGVESLETISMYIW